MGWKRRSWGICGPHSGIFGGAAWLVCTAFALFTTPIEGRVVPNQSLEQVIEMKYCPGDRARIQVYEYLQQQNSRIQVGQGNIHTYYIQELESKTKQEQEQNTYEIP